EQGHRRSLRPTAPPATSESAGLDYCPYNGYFTDSDDHAGIESHGKIRSQTHPLNHRKPDSSPQSPQFRAPAPGISDRKGDRTAAGSRSHAVPLWAPRRHNDFNRIPSRAARLGSLRVAVGPD